MFRSKLPQVETTIFTVMTNLANTYEAINLAQGFPGFDCYPYLQDLVAEYMQKGYNQYAPMHGVGLLRQRIEEKSKNLYGVNFDMETEITVVSGATEALFVAITTVVQPGDEVIVLEPAYDSYVPAIQLSGGLPVYVQLHAKDFSVDWQQVKDAISERTKAIIINNPHNPGGYVWKKADFETLSELIGEREIYIISDEVYDHILFDERKHLSPCMFESLQQKTFVCGSLGKTFHVTGWKIGYCLAPVQLTKEFRKIHQYVTFSTATPFQFALADFMVDPTRYLHVGEFYESKRNLFLKGLRETKFKFTPAEGSFFQTVSYGHLSKEADYELAKKMTVQAKVAAIPVSSFYHEKKDHKQLRFCFAKEDDVLEEAVDRLIDFSRHIR
ncbi:methionine aminotransferase [Mongoliitalea daihaiensis]|uniref:methionine aminotransferase n=1 Tax=Mongoliitalea daihaiensis TaxID=2782006 RepID=UPI001F2D0CDE|nr:methionine aminotransferase [Mongoliitalea daihaiensis]UJP63468.1 aminotransferase class I/II-fold pyridoxal phosphate-dependent enzyme [Mongoliitalea daihaiensis]